MVATFFVPDLRLSLARALRLQRICVTLTYATTLFAVPILLAPPSSAQPSDDSASATAQSIEVLHTPVGTAEIPPVGSLMKVNVSLANTVDIETKIRVVGTKDGRFFDIAFPRGALNNSDKPSFSIELPSPVAMMSYQFVVHQRDGSLTSSRKFIIKRRCLQTFGVNVPDDKRTTAFRREVASLVAQAHMLERDNKSLETSLKLLEDIKSSLSR